MSSEDKVLKQLSSFERTIFQIGKKAFDRHSENCPHQIPKDSGNNLCGITGNACEFQRCPALKSKKGTDGGVGE